MDTQPFQIPAIGINAISTTATPEAIADTVRRVASNTTSIFVATPPDTPTLHHHLEETPAEIITIVDPDTDPTQALVAAAKDASLPGIVLHPRSGGGATLEFEDSIRKFWLSENDAVSGIATAPTTASQVAVLIATDHDSAAIAQLRTSVAPHCDELLVVSDDGTTTDLDDVPFELPTKQVSSEASESASPVATAVAHIRQNYTEFEAAVLLNGNTTTATDSTHILPDLLTLLTDSAADIAVGRQLDALSERGSGRADAHFSGVRKPDGGPETTESIIDLCDTTIALDPTAAATLDSHLDRHATHSELVDAADRSDLTVAFHDYTPDNGTTPTVATNFGPVGPDDSPTFTATDSTLRTDSAPPPTTDDTLSESARPEQPSASNRVLNVVYCSGIDDRDPEVTLTTVRDALAELPAETEVTVPGTTSRVLRHIVNADDDSLDSFLVTSRERAKSVDALAKTLGLDILPLPMSDPSTSTLATHLQAHLNRYPKSQLIITAAAINDTSGGTRVVAPTADTISGDTPPDEPESTGDIVVGIPAYNEAGSIAEVVHDAAQCADTVLVVDDASDDATADTAATAGATVIQHEKNRGYGGALNTIFAEAARRDPAHLVILDGDGQHDCSDIPAAIATRETSNADIVIGSRFTSDADTDLPVYRRVGLGIVNVLTNLSMGVVRRDSWVNDTQSGFRTYSQRAIKSLHKDDSIGDGMSASTDILHHAHRQEYDIEEIGTEVDYNVEDPSSHNPVTHGLTLVTNILRTIEHERPVTSLGVPGFVSTLVGLGFGYWTFSHYISTGMFPLGLAVTSSSFGLAGIFACFTAIILHSLNTHLD